MSTQSNEVADNGRMYPDILKNWYDAFNNMTTNELIEVEYSVGSSSNEWNLMYANRHNAGGRLCVLCDVVLMNSNSIKEHNTVKKHRENVEIKVRKFRHPSIHPEQLTIVINPCAANIEKINEMKEKLRNEIINMNLIDMELIEYKFTNTEWNKLLTKNDVGYVCNMCKSYTLINLKIIKNHLQTAKHKSNLDLLQGFYHPNIAPIKDILQPPLKVNNDKLMDMVKNPFSVNNLPQKAKDLIEKHADINVDLLLHIEVQQKPNDKWEKLISKPNNTNQCTCTVCKLNIVGISELRKHLRIESHIKNIKNINGIHHSILAPFKNVVPVTSVTITDSGKNKENVSVKNKENVESVKTKENVEAVKTKENSEPLKTKENSETEKTKVNSEYEKTKQTSESVKTKESGAEIVKIQIEKDTESVKNVDLPVKEKVASINNTTDKSTISTSKGNSEPLKNIELSEKKDNKNNGKPTASSPPKNQTSNNKFMSDKEFRNIIPTLKHIDLINIEFFKQDKWSKMIVCVERTYNCNLCSVTKISNIKCLSDHLKGKKHAANLITVSRLYHPTKTFAKNVDNAKTGKTLAKPKEQPVPKIRNTNNAENLMHANININTEIITVEDSPDRELKEKQNDNETTTKSITNRELSIVSNRKSQSDNKKVQNESEKENNNKKDQADNMVSQDMDIEADDDVIVEADSNIVLNPAAVIAQNLNKSNDGVNVSPQYQQNRIITPRIKAGQTLTKELTSKSDSPTSTDKLSSDKTLMFSTKALSGTSNVLEGLIGIEYVVKIIQHAADDSPRFECCLCEIELGGIAMQNHLRNLKHRLKYLDRHFQTCVKLFNKHRNDGIIMTEIVDRIAKAIEKYHGRDLPYECMQSDYRRNRQDVMAKVYSFRHASELSGPSFTNIVNKNVLDDIIRNKHRLGDKIPEIDKRKTTFDKENTDNSKRQRINSPKNPPNISNRNPVPPKQPNFPNRNPISQPIVRQSYINHIVRQSYPLPYNTVQPIPISQSLGLDDAEHRRLSENFIKNTKIRSPPHRRRISPPPRRHRTRTPPRRYGRSRSRSPPRRHIRERKRSQSRSPLREGDVWQAYRRKFDIDVKILDSDYEAYNKDPQSYPLYNDEWQNFWAKRMNQLKGERKDHLSYDFTSEWASYFPRRLRELHGNDVEELKVRLRERFVLPMHNRELKDKRYFVKEHYDDNEQEIYDDTPMPPIISSSNYRVYRKRESRSRSKLRSMSRSRSRSSHNSYEIKMGTEILRSEILNSDVVNSGQQGTHKKRNTKNKDKDDRIDFGPLTVVSVLRLLTALEDNLGSLGPRVVDLLSKALTLEKVKLNHSDEILLTVENCVFLETCSEKLKGQVLAGVIATTKLRAVRQAIKDITALVNKANEERAKNPPVKPQVLRKTPIISKPATSTTTPSVAKVQTPTNPPAMRGNANNQIPQTSIKQIIAQPSQHPTVMSQAQKKDLATKLASALAAQGKTDISTTNCEKLIEVYAMIDKKKSEEAGNRDSNKQSLSDTLTDILNSGNLPALSALLQSNKQQNAPVASTATNNQLNQNQFYNQQGYRNSNNNNNFNSNLMPQNRYNNNFNQLANFDTSLNITSVFDANRQQLNNSQNQMNANAGGQSMQIWRQNQLPQGNNQNWISGNDMPPVIQKSQMRGASILNTDNLLSQTLLNSSHLRNNRSSINDPSATSRIDTGSQNSPAYATGASYRANNTNNDTVSYPNLWHRQNRVQQQLSNYQNINSRNSSGVGNADNQTVGLSNREQMQNQQQTVLGNRYGTNNDGRNVSNSGQTDRMQNRRSDFDGRS